MEAPVHVPLGQDGGERGRPSPLTRPEVSIAIVSYNTRDLLRRCLATIGCGTTRPYEVIVVDNASADGSAAMVSEEFPSVRLLENRENAGYSRAVNQAIRSAAGTYVLVLNPDIEVLPGSIDALARHLDEHPDTGIAGGKLLNPDGTLQYSCRTFYTLSTLLHRRTPIGKLFPDSRVEREHLMMDWDHETVREVDWMLGACLMVRSEAIRDVGLMDERFFMYFEDVDWCYRMKQHGWRVMYVPEARMKHVHRRDSARGGGLVNTRLLAHLNSMFRFFDKWNSRLFRLRRHRGLVVGGALLVADLAAVILSFLAAFGVRSVLGSVLQRPVFPLAAYRPFVLLTVFVVLAGNAVLGLYRRRAGRDAWDDAVDLAKGLALSTLVLMASTFLTGSELHSRLMVGVFVPLAFASMLAGRMLFGAASRAMRRGRYDLTRVVVLGERTAAAEVAAGIEGRPELGYEIVTVLPDHPGDDERRFREFWDAEGIRDVVRRHRVGEVLLVRPTISDREVARLVLLCRRDGVRVRLVSGAADYLPGTVGVAELVGRPVADLGPPAGGTFQRALHRITDVVLAGAGLLLLGPAAWFRAVRRPREGEPSDLVHGLGGRTFRRRLTPPGGRRRAETLGHVLRGELALVGPRPVAPEIVARSEELRVLFDLVRPGATGTWRLHEAEGLGSEEELSLALSYLQNQSPLEDLKMVLRTLALPSPTPEKKRSLS